MTNKNKEYAEAWRKQYEDGTALDDIAAIESYRLRRPLSTSAVRSAIVWAGGKIRTYSETVNLKLKKKFSRDV